MPFIGAVSCNFVKGEAPNLTETSERWRIKGRDGHGVQLTGRGGGEFRFTAIRLAASATVETWKASIEALVGSIVTIVNDRGISTLNCFIESSEPLRATAAVAVGRDTKGILEIRGVVKQ